MRDVHALRMFGIICSILFGILLVTVTDRAEIAEKEMDKIGNGEGTPGIYTKFAQNRR